MMNIKNQSILITAAGSGIGRATAIALARKGARLTLFGRRQEPLEETARLVQEAGSEARVVTGDVTNVSAGGRAIRTATEQYGGLDVLINNAGNVRAGRLETIELEDIRAQIEVNLTGPILLTRAALPALRSSNDAAIVNVSSAIGLVGMPFYATYAATKAGIAHFSEALRRELYGEGVRVMTVYPGATDTPMMESTEAGPELGFEYEPAEAVADALVEGLETKKLEVIRGGEARSAMIAANREQPQEVDARLAQMKEALERATTNHRSI